MHHCLGWFLNRFYWHSHTQVPSPPHCFLMMQDFPRHLVLVSTTIYSISAVTSSNCLQVLFCTSIWIQWQLLPLWFGIFLKLSKYLKVPRQVAGITFRTRRDLGDKIIQTPQFEVERLKMMKQGLEARFPDPFLLKDVILRKLLWWYKNHSFSFIFIHFQKVVYSADIFRRI